MDTTSSLSCLRDLFDRPLSNSASQSEKLLSPSHDQSEPESSFDVVYQISYWARHMLQGNSGSMRVYFLPLYLKYGLSFTMSVVAFLLGVLLKC